MVASLACWRGSGIYFVFGVNGYLVGLVSLQQ